MSTDIMGAFSPLDEMIQLIYQSIYQFVVMSSATHDKWTVHVGMVGEAGRWWRGVWEERDAVHFVGPKPSEKLLETFVDKLVDSIVGGELHLADFSTEKGAKINLTFGSTNTKPVSMNLEELAPAEAAAHATNVFLEIALQAQSRKCRLHPSAFASISVPSTRTSVGTSKVSGFDTDSRLDAEKTKPTAGESSISNRTTIKARNPELETNDVEMKTTEPGTGTRTLRSEEKEKPKKRQHSPSEKARQPSIKPKAPTRPPAKAGASLANPNKKVRKIQAMEFESDDE